MKLSRPNPDDLLKRVQSAEQKEKRGKLKIFFGANPGVGKTYAMLQAAQERRLEDVDVIVGVVETHNRVETAALLEGLEILPRKTVDYKGVTLKEFDLDSALRRNPKLILIDELAHTNVPNSRHARRWQDVEELIMQGIDVYSTMNVQHWESLNDVIAQITGVIVRETVPDSFLELVDDIELIDLPPEDLLKRLKEGKVYQGENAAKAAENFFHVGNLIALRELALRVTAERVDDEMREFKEDNSIQGVWNVRDRIMVAISPSPMAPRLVRQTSRMAKRLKAEWIAVYIDNPGSKGASPKQRSRVLQTMRLAEELGAQTVTLIGENVADELLSYAKAKNVTRIVLGKPARPPWKELLQGSIINKMARNAGDIDLLIVSGLGSSLEERKHPQAPKRQWPGILWAFISVSIQSIIYWSFLRPIGQLNIALLFILGIMLIAYFYGRRISLYASLLSVLAYDFFFVPPFMTLYVADPHFFITVLVMLSVGAVISTLTGRLKSHTKALRKRGIRAEALYSFSRALSGSISIEAIAKEATRQLEEYYKSPVIILLPDFENRLVVNAGNTEGFAFDEKEKGTAEWVYLHGHPAGKGTSTLAGAKGFYLPLKALQSTVGVLGVCANWIEDTDPEQKHLLETFAAEIARATESTRLAEMSGRLAEQAESDRFKSMVLARFSHDLHAPLKNVIALLAQLPEPVGPPSILHSIKSKISGMYEMTSEVMPSLQGKTSEKGLLLKALSPGSILLEPDPISLEDLLTRMLKRLNIPNSEGAIQELIQSEKAISTCIGRGIMIPHIRLGDSIDIRASLGICRSGILGVNEPTRICLLFVSSMNQPKEHLAFLAQLARLFQSESIVDELIAAESPDDIRPIISRHEIQELLPGGR